MKDLTLLKSLLLISPSGEELIISDIKCDEHENHYEIIVNGKNTKWKHKIITEEI